MKTKQIGNLFELAEKQLLFEIQQGRRKLRWYSLDIKGIKLIRPYSFKDLLKYIVILRKQLDRYGKNGEILKVRNVKTKELINLELPKEVRYRKYLKEKIGRR